MTWDEVMAYAQELAEPGAGLLGARDGARQAEPARARGPGAGGGG